MNGGTYPRQHDLALALYEIGRIERTVFIIDWLLDAELRGTGPRSGSTRANRTTRSRARMVRLERSHIRAVPTDAAGAD